MSNPMSTFDVPTRWVFRAYATLTIALGALGLDGNAAAGLGAKLQPAELVLHSHAASPWGLYVVPRLAGCVLLAVGLLALAFAALEDPEARRRSLNRFAIVHVVFGFLYSGIASALLDEFVPRSYIWSPLIVGLVLGFLAVLQPVPRRRGSQAIEQLRSQYEAQIREAARREERARLARDLHDAVKQQLFAIQTGAATVEARLQTDVDGALAATAVVRSSAHEALAEMEALIDQLQAAPLENAGLVEALRRQTEALGFRTGARVDFIVGDLPPNTSLTPGAQEGLYRFAQEALANVARHARATHVTLRLHSAGETLELSVVDDGVGFEQEAPPGGMGHRNMTLRAEELGGECIISSAPGCGTSVRCVVPVGGSSTLRRTVAWVGTSAVAGFLMYSCGGVNDQGRPPYLFGLQFLSMFALSLAIAMAVSGLWYLSRRLRPHTP